MLVFLRSVILRTIFEVNLLVQSHGLLYSFTHKQIDLKKKTHNLSKLIYRTALHDLSLLFFHCRGSCRFHCHVITPCRNNARKRFKKSVSFR